ncbi:Protein CBG26338 [Caenorhabditis briggsae]|uniref:Protein CBG26338 n=1 Tax=Caenorhabditis briggsae TaxID=6238 RepID=B6IGB0_CAEBR|nr:Protein CBG26338 [Caenorhabditis briggsae]CAR98940.1 Protein CBG26338 [Caenorhabditis briggsae]
MDHCIFHDDRWLNDF